MRVLVLLDGSTFAESVLPAASSLNGLGGTQLELARVVELESHEQTTDRLRTMLNPSDRVDDSGRVIGSFPGTGQSHLETGAQVGDRIRFEAREYLSGISGRYFPEGAESVVLIGTDAAQEVIKYAQSAQIDLIALASHGRTGVARVLMGSVAEKILRSGVCPVLMVRPNLEE